MLRHRHRRVPRRWTRSGPRSRRIRRSLLRSRVAAQASSHPAAARSARHWSVASTRLQGRRGEGKDAVSTDATDDENASGDFDAQKFHDEMSKCLAEVEKNSDPRQYTTTIAAQDLEDLRQALGAPQFDLVGVSYGTRMAQQYLMRYPDGVRSVVLDSVAPNELIFGQNSRRTSRAHSNRNSRCARRMPPAPKLSAIPMRACSSCATRCAPNRRTIRSAIR